MNALFAKGDGKGLERLDQALTQAVVDAPDIDATAKNEALEHLSYLVQQATLPPEQRHRSVGRTVVRALERLLHVAASITQPSRRVAPAAMRMKTNSPDAMSRTPLTVR